MYLLSIQKMKNRIHTIVGAHVYMPQGLLLRVMGVVADENRYRRHDPEQDNASEVEHTELLDLCLRRVLRQPRL